MNKIDNQTESSDAMILLTHVWRCSRHVKPFSEARFRSTLHDALDLAIIGGLKFDTDDCSKIKDTFYWGAGYYREQLLSFDDLFTPRLLLLVIYPLANHLNTTRTESLLSPPKLTIIIRCFAVCQADGI